MDIKNLEKLRQYAISILKKNVLNVKISMLICEQPYYKKYIPEVVEHFNVELKLK